MTKGLWRLKPPCSEESLRELVASAPKGLPAEYLDFLRMSNGGGGDIGVEPGLLYLWPAEEVPRENRAYEVDLNVPGFYAFGTSSTGEMFAFDLREGEPWAVVIIPFIPMRAEEAIQVAENFAAFRRSFGVRIGEDAPEVRLDDWGHPRGEDSDADLAG